MVCYLLSYDDKTGEILSFDRFYYTGTYSDISSGTMFSIEQLPTGFLKEAYRVDITRLSQSGMPLYIIERASGEAYDHYGERASSADVSPDEEEEEEEEETESSVTYSNLNNNYNLFGENDLLISPRNDADGYSLADSYMQFLSGTQAVFANISLSADDGTWLYDSNTQEYSKSVLNSFIDNTTSIHITGVNRDALISHLYWKAYEGGILFTTKSRPVSDILITAVLRNVSNDVEAKGVIEAWPGMGLVSKRYRYSIQEGGDTPIVLSAAGSANQEDSKTIATSVQFANAKLMMAYPEYTGNPRVVMPRIFVGVVENNSVLCYTLTNTSSQEVTLTDISIRLLYRGEISGLVTEAEDENSIEPYITEVDIDMLT